MGYSIGELENNTEKIKGTQGVVSFTKDEKTLIKVITGLDGQNAQKFIDTMFEQYPMEELERIPDKTKIYQIALDAGFGGKISLVVMSESNITSDGFDSRTLQDYFNTFENPIWNPRWKHGTAEYIKVVELTNMVVVQISQ